MAPRRLPPSPWPWVNKTRARAHAHALRRPSVYVTDPNYEQVDTVPDGIRWKPARGAPKHNTVVLVSMFGGLYKLIRDTSTGAVTYYKLKGEPPPATPKEQIDAEPERPKQQRFHTGTFCWFVSDIGAWFCCEVVSRENNSITLRPTTGWDADKKVPWPFDGDLTIHVGSQSFKRIRKLKDRPA